MAETSTIEWTDATWNPVTGCTLVSEGCRHCYAAQLAATRLKNHPSREGLARLNAQGEAKFTGEVRLNEQWLDEPLRWKRPRRIFVCAHGDLFHEAVPDEWIDRVFAVMALAPQHTFQVLTKRPERMRDYMARRDNRDRVPALDYAVLMACTGRWSTPAIDLRGGWPLPNVWLGTSVEDQATADARIPALLDTPAVVRFVSAEPLLGPVSLVDRDPIRLATGVDARPENRVYVSLLRGWGLGPHRRPGLDWVIVGGESGRNARPMHPDWARSLRDQCVAAGVPFFFKQWGEWVTVLDREAEDPDFRADYQLRYGDHGRTRWLNLAGGCGFHGQRFHVMERVGKSHAGRELDGQIWDQMPTPATPRPGAST
jgi:protein gp37